MAEAIEDPPTGSPPGTRAPPARRRGSVLEDEMAALLAGTALLADDAKSAGKDAMRIKRRSREVSEELNCVSDEFSTFASAAKVWSTLGGLSSSADLSDEALRKAFDEIDLDHGGTLDHDELTAAIKKAMPDASEADVKAMLDFADKDGNGEITFEEYKEIVLAASK